MIVSYLRVVFGLETGAGTRSDSGLHNEPETWD